MVVLFNLVAIVAMGVVFWILGETFGYGEVSVIAGIIVLGAGAIVIDEPVRYKAGEVIDTTENASFAYTNESNWNDSEFIRNNSTASGRQVVTNQYATVAFPERFSLGFLLMLLGASGIYRGALSFQ